MSLIAKALILVILLTLQQNTTQCGLKQNRSYMVAHGYDTKPGEWPWHAALYRMKNQKWVNICGGTLISPQFVLTAAHCIIADTGYDLRPAQIMVRLGIHDFGDLRTVQQRNILEIYKPGNFTRDGTKNDIAILELSKLAQLNSYVQRACLGKLPDILTGYYGTAVGWGKTESGEMPSKLRSARIPVVKTSTCKESNPGAFGPTLDETFLCAGYTNGTSVCEGDSGGGLFFQSDNAWYVGGIVSFAPQSENGMNSCHTDNYAAFASVNAYLTWILKITKLRLTPGRGRPTQSSPSTSNTNVDCGPGCREFNCHVDSRCDSNVVHTEAVHYPHRDCTKYYTCKERTNIICAMNCPAGLHFNRHKKVCDWPWSAGCNS